MTEPRPRGAPVVQAESVRYGSAMLRQFGWFYYLLGLGWLLGKLRLEEHGVDRVRAAAERGPLVYVLDRADDLDHLALNTVLARRRLPLSVWANGVTSFWWQPVVEAWRELGQRLQRIARLGRAPDPVRSGWLARAVAAGAPVTVFVQERRSWSDRWDGLPAPDPFAALLEAQGATERPVLLVPVVIVWNRSPDKRGAMAAFVSGVQAPGLIASLVGLLRGDAFVQIGDPVSLAELQERVPPPRQARAARLLVRRWLHREGKIVRGPTLLPHAEMRRMVLDNPSMRQLAAAEAQASGKRVEQIRRRMEKDFDLIAARFSFWMVRAAYVFLRPLWTRVYSGVDVRPEDLERIRAAMRGGSAVLVPSHKSHFDYVLLAWVFYEHDLIVPHVVAGANLAIWPVSIFLRGAGGFFIKRSFGDDRVFPEVFSRYLRELIRQGYPVEFYIEGGRTRTGKPLPPKLGVLGMVFDAASLRPAQHEVTLLPIALAYEQVAEERVYARELGGEEKKPETVGQLVQARSVLRRRFGRVYLRVAEPIPTSPLVDPTPESPGWGDRPRPERKVALQVVGERIMHRIGRATVVLSTSLVALALLAHPRRGVRHAELVARADRFLAFLRHHGAPEAASLAHLSEARAQALERFEARKLIVAHTAEGDRVWSIEPEGRIQLDFYKNQAMPWFTLACYAAAAIRALPEGAFALGAPRERFLRLIWLLRREFLLDPDRAASDQLLDGLAALEAHGAIGPASDGAFQVVDPSRIGEIYSLLRPFLESYALALGAPERHPGLDRKALVSKLLGEGPAALADGTLTRPEALSRETLANALSAYVESGVFIEEDGVVRPREDAVAATRALLAPMVG